MSDLAIGQTVELANGHIAVIRYMGQAHFAEGDWVGVELEGTGGKNDGSVGGQRYFDCPMYKGMFLRPSAMTVIDQPPPVVAKPANGAAKRPGRPSSVVGSGVGRRMSTAPDPAASKRMSMNAASPSPATRSRPSSVIRVCQIHYSP